jgi:atypical dual specificity phosphatase
LFSWIVPDQIAAMAMPAVSDLRKLRATGVSLLVSAVPEPFDPHAVQRAGLHQLHIPVEYFRAPSEEQIGDFIEAVRAELEDGGKVAVHCIGGLGRTGTLIASYLVTEGMDPEKAIAFVRQRRPGSLESMEQENAVFAWADADARAAAAPLLAYVGSAPELPGRRPGVSEFGIRETQPSHVMLREERDAMMANSSAKGYLRWGTNGSEVDIRALSAAPGDTPRVEELKAALDGFRSQDGVTVTLTEVLGRNGEAWVTVSCAPGRQSGLLMAAGEIVDQLMRARVYDEVLLCNP